MRTVCSVVGAFLLASSAAAQSLTFTTFAGSAGGAGSDDGTASAARFNRPGGVATDASGDVYVVDSGNYTIRKIAPSGDVTTLAGLAGRSGSDDGIGSVARFNQPSAVATDGNGNVYVADTGNHAIRKITPAGVVTTLAGSAGFPGSTDGRGSEARFRSPLGIATNGSGNVYVADSNNSIRKITPDGVVSTFAGSAEVIGSADGAGSEARFSSPFSVASAETSTLRIAATAPFERLLPAV